MKTVDRQSQYYNRLMAKLNDQESQIEKLQKERDELVTKLNQQRAELENFLSNTTWDNACPRDERSSFTCDVSF